LRIMSDNLRLSDIKILIFRSSNGNAIPRPYAMGTVQADAYYAGIDEGHRIFRDYEAGKNDE